MAPITSPLKAVPVTAPSAVNPFKELRQSKNLSHAALGKIMHISKLALIRLEQGCYTEPLPTVLDYWVKEGGYNRYALEQDYERFQSDMRLSNWKYFGNSLTVGTVGHPFIRLRVLKGVNTTEVAKALCIPQSTLLHFENKFKTQVSVPRQVIVVLSENGYSTQQLRDFDDSYRAFRELMKHGI